MLSLYELFNSLPSPAPDPALISHVSPHQAALFDASLDGDIPGITVTLYPHQKRSLWKMLYCELSPPFGGLVCEDMGTGKTCLCLALICLTRGQLAKLDVFTNESMSPVTTILHHSPRPSPPAPRRILPRASCAPSSKVAKPVWEDFPQRSSSKTYETVEIPSLASYCAHIIATSRYSHFYEIDESTDVYGNPYSHLAPLVQKFEPFCIAYPSPGSTTRSRRALPPDPIPIYVSRATLVVVPDSLIGQWEQEIDKHVLKGFLRILIVTKEALPSADTLAYNYDIVITTISRFSKEGRFGSGFEAAVPAMCNCTYNSSSHEIVHSLNCSPRRDPPSPLALVCWRRLILDEGHIAGRDNHALDFTSKIRSESRWLVSGTPTRNLVGYGSLATDQNHTEQTYSRYPEMEPYTSSSDTTLLDPSVVSQEAAGDKEDYIRLKKMFFTFLRLSSSILDIDRSDTSTITSNGGINASLSTETLSRLTNDFTHVRSLLQRLTVRHRIEDIENEISLPPLHRRVVYFKMSTLVRQSYNAILAAFVTNSVTSKRDQEDMRDYLFHPSNERYLSQLIRNLSSSQFYFASNELIDLVHFTEKNIDEALNSRHYDENARDLLRQSKFHLNDAKNNTVWVGCIEAQGMPYLVESIPDDIAKPWKVPSSHSTSILAQSSGMDLSSNVFVGEKILEIRSALHKLLYIDSWEGGEDLAEELITAGTVSAHKENNTSHSTHSSSPHDIANSISKLLAKRTSNAVESPGKIINGKKHNKKNNKFHDENLASRSSSSSSLNKNNGEESTALSRQVPPDAPFLDAAIVCSASPKLNYIIEQVLEHPDEKFLIFVPPARNEAYFIGEALEMIGVKHLFYVSEGLDHTKRALHLATFQSSTDYRVLIMSLKLSARGLNVTAASRVIFTEPCWQPDVQAQAEKRAHRIGQTRPVHIETLVMKDSFEETVLKRRKALHKSDFKTKVSPQDDAQLRTVLQESHFVPSNKEDSNEYNKVGKNFGEKWKLSSKLLPTDRLIPVYDDAIIDKRKGGSKRRNNISHVSSSKRRRRKPEKVVFGEDNNNEQKKMKDNKSSLLYVTVP